MLFITEEAKEKYYDYIESALKTVKKSYIITEEIADILYDVADDIYNMYMAKTLLQQSRRDDVRLFIKDIKREKYID